MWYNFPGCRIMNYDFQNEMEPWIFFVSVLETSKKAWIKVYRKLFSLFLAAELLRISNTFLFLLSDRAHFQMWSWGIPALLHMWDPGWTQKVGQFTHLFPPRQSTFITVHNWNWRPLGFPYFEKAQKEPLQLLMKGCREELELSQQSLRFVLDQSLIQFIMRGLCWSPSIR